jgi:hypothetical protein
MLGCEGLKPAVAQPGKDALANSSDSRGRIARARYALERGGLIAEADVELVEYDGRAFTLCRLPATASPEQAMPQPVTSRSRLYVRKLA